MKKGEEEKTHTEFIQEMMSVMMSGAILLLLMILLLQSNEKHTETTPGFVYEMCGEELFFPSPIRLHHLQKVHLEAAAFLTCLKSEFALADAFN